MLVKKIDPEWVPSENKELQVGDTIEISNPRELVLSGKVEAVDSNGIVISAYELYGVIDGKEKEAYEEYLEWKKIKQQKVLASRLEQENAELKKQLIEEADQEPDLVVVEPEAREVNTKELTTSEKRALALEKARAARKKK